jgi:hypothetical protein
MIHEIAKRTPVDRQFAGSDGWVRVVAVGPLGKIHSARVRDIQFKPACMSVGGDIRQGAGLGRDAGPECLKEHPKCLFNLKTQAKVTVVEARDVDVCRFEGDNGDTILSLVWQCGDLATQNIRAAIEDFRSRVPFNLDARAVDCLRNPWCIKII